MSETMGMAELLKNYEKVSDVSRGDILTGKVISINKEEALLDIAFMSDGILEKTEVFEEDWDGLQVGDEIPCYVLKVSEMEGTVLLSAKRAQEFVVWDTLKSLLETQKPVSVRIKEAVKGGVVALYKGVRVFIPASQLDLSYVETFESYLGQKVDVVITEVNQEKNKVVASQRVVLKALQEKKRSSAYARLKEGEVLTGTVVRLADYGAFVNIGEVDGLIHISQLSWRRVKHPSEVVKEGDLVEVIVTQIDAESGRVGLKLAKVQENPWDTIANHYEENQVVTGVVTRITNFGAFIELEEGVEGLCHISELSDAHVNRVQEVVQIGDTVEVLILSVDAIQHQMALSVKAALEVSETTYEMPEEEQEDAPTTLSDLFGDKLKNLKF